MAESRPPFPPFTLETATQKVRMAEDAWNTRDPQRVALAYTTDSRWRNRAEFLQGRAEIEAFLTRKWQRCRIDSRHQPAIPSCRPRKSESDPRIPLSQDDEIGAAEHRRRSIELN